MKETKVALKELQDRYEELQLDFEIAKEEKEECMCNVLECSIDYQYRSNCRGQLHHQKQVLKIAEVRCSRMFT